MRGPRGYFPRYSRSLYGLLRVRDCAGATHKLEFVRVIALFLWRDHRLGACPSPPKSDIDRAFAYWSCTMTNASMNRDQMPRQELDSVIIKVDD